MKELVGTVTKVHSSTRPSFPGDRPGPIFKKTQKGSLSNEGPMGIKIFKQCLVRSGKKALISSEKPLRKRITPVHLGGGEKSRRTDPVSVER